MSGSLKAYLAANYMSLDRQDKFKEKKKKKKKKEKGTTTVIDEDAGWNLDNEDEDDNVPVVTEVEGEMNSHTFKTPADSGWITISEERRSPSASPIPSEAAEESRRRSPSASPSPSPSPDSGVKRMSDGTAAGLQTAESIRKDLEREKRKAMERLKAMDDNKSIGRDAQTVYRDRFGKKVDIATQIAQQEAQKSHKEAQEAERMHWGKGIVQTKQQEALQKRLSGDGPLTVYADNESLNKQLMDRDRWGDPMASSNAKNPPNNTTRKKKRVSYNGEYLPNRFGIAPGYRWDGIDRSNGFEAKLVQQKHSTAIFKQDAYKWSTEDM